MSFYATAAAGLVNGKGGNRARMQAVQGIERRVTKKIPYRINREIIRKNMRMFLIYFLVICIRELAIAVP
jgi:hypothetical protein